MRFNNQTGSAVTVNGLNNLFLNPTGLPVLKTAVVERAAGVVDNVKGPGNSVVAFNVGNNESCVFRITWDFNGIFSLQGTTNNSYKNIVRSSGCEIYGNGDVPHNFMMYLFYQSVNYNQQTGDIFDTSQWRPNSIGNNFLYSTWEGCTSLTNSVIPNTLNWSISNSIGNYFMYSTWKNCTMLVRAVAPTLNTNLRYNYADIGAYFLNSTWEGCTNLYYAAAPTITYLKDGSIKEHFLDSTWKDCTSLETSVVPTINYNETTTLGDYYFNSTWKGCVKLRNFTLLQQSDITYFGTYFLNSTWENCTDFNGNSTIDVYWFRPTYIPDGFLNNTWRGCTSLGGVFEHFYTENWRPSYIGDNFMYGTWADCTSMVYGIRNTTGFITTKWRPTSIGSCFMKETFLNCSEVNSIRIIDTDYWPITGSIGDDFFYRTFYGCESLSTDGGYSYYYMIGTGGWIITSIGDNFMYQTWYGCEQMHAYSGSTTYISLPYTGSWNVSSIGNNFLNGTFENALSSYRANDITIFGEIYLGNITPLVTNSAGIDNTKVNTINCHEMVTDFQNSPYWSNITDSKFIPY
jgi:hypothetical protein